MLLVLLECAVCLEALLQCPKDFVKVNHHLLATLRQSHMLRYTLHGGPSLSSVSLLHPDVHHVAAVVLARETGGLKLLHLTLRTPCSRRHSSAVDKWVG